MHAEALRYYESLGLIPLPEKSENGYRMYPEKLLDRLRLISLAKDCGFTLLEIRDFLSGSPEAVITGSCESLIKIIDQKHALLDNQIQNLVEKQKLLAELRRELLHPHKQAFRAFLP
ncbi:MAG: MerR family DNA-binding protein [Clostridia bacterium]|nr:MerR family DNA-binding protein [Clostridia bacterium]